MFQRVNLPQCSSLPCVQTLLGALLQLSLLWSQAGGVAVPRPDHACCQGHCGACGLQSRQGNGCSLLLKSQEIKWQM